MVNRGDSRQEAGQWDGPADLDSGQTSHASIGSVVRFPPAVRQHARLLSLETKTATPQGKKANRLSLAGIQVASLSDSAWITNFLNGFCANYITTAYENQPNHQIWPVRNTSRARDGRRSPLQVTKIRPIRNTPNDQNQRYLTMLIYQSATSPPIKASQTGSPALTFCKK